MTLCKVNCSYTKSKHKWFTKFKLYYFKAIVLNKVTGLSLTKLVLMRDIKNN